MKEFGSDFHEIKDYVKGTPLTAIYGDSLYYASGRQALQTLILNNNWKRLWVPAYYCYDALSQIKKVKILFYEDLPYSDDTATISKIPFGKDDVLLRMNYFGMRAFRNNCEIPVPVIEDHSHDLIGDWASHSNADWCIASLRKTLPISEGGILWSPKKLSLPEKPMLTEENISLAENRHKAMILKADFLAGSNNSFSEYRSLYIATEKEIETLPISEISPDSFNVINELDIKNWYERKQNNWKYLAYIEQEDVEILKAESQTCNVFSLVLRFNNFKVRERVREILIKEQHVYPAILWNIPNDQYLNAVNYGKTMLSIHCDARYDQDLVDLRQRIITAIRIAINND